MNDVNQSRVDNVASRNISSPARKPRSIIHRPASIAACLPAPLPAPLAMSGNSTARLPPPAAISGSSTARLPPPLPAAPAAISGSSSVHSARRAETRSKFPNPKNCVTIAVSPRVLFNMDVERLIYEQKGMENYLTYQVEHEAEPLKPGPAFPFIKAVEEVNMRLRELYPDSEEVFDVVLMTNNHANVGLRLINSVNHYNLFIERFCMTGGNSPIGYLKAYHTNLYLSADAIKVREALDEGIAAATMFSLDKVTEVPETELRVAFDGDAVLFDDESERIFKTQGLDKFFEHERALADKPLDHGPLKGFLEALGKLQKKFYAKGQRLECPIRTYLVTARSAASSGTRALKTLRSWGLEIDEALFLAGAPKGPMLEKIRPHIFFDDQMFHVRGASRMGTVAAHVPYGIAQRLPRKPSVCNT